MTGTRLLSLLLHVARCWFSVCHPFIPIGIHYTLSPHFNVKECFSKEKKKQNSSIVIVVCNRSPFVISNFLGLYFSKSVTLAFAPNIFLHSVSLHYMA